MARNDKDLSETDIRHPDSELLTVRADPVGDGRPWHEAAAVCRLLGQHRIAHLGVARMLAPFEIVRTALGGSYFLACFGGAGELLVNGRWEHCGEGQAFLLSPGTLHAFRAVGAPGRGRWDFCWVRYREIRGQSTVARASSPVLGKFFAPPFVHAVSGLYHASRSADPQPVATPHDTSATASSGRSVSTLITCDSATQEYCENVPSLANRVSSGPPPAMRWRLVPSVTIPLTKAPAPASHRF